MPNYVYNSLSISGENHKKVLKLIEDVKGEDTILDFKKIIPVPEKERKNHEQEQFWKKCNWGCKWNAMDIELDDCTYYFLTPWNPPIPIVKALSKQYPDLIITLEYAEETGCDSGHIEFVNGEISNSNFIYKKENNEYYEKLWGIE